MKTTPIVFFFAALLAAACGDAAPPPAAPAPVLTASAPPKRAPVSGIDKANFDPAVRPQDDLFRAVNGGWIAKTEIPTDKPTYGAGQKIHDATQLRLRTIIEAASGATNAAGSEAEDRRRLLVVHG